MRRRRQHAAVSLFAFQDVMAAVIGILFFVVLLLSLELVEAATKGSPAAQAADLKTLRAEHESLQQQVAQSQATLESMAEDAGDLLVDEEALASQVLQLDQRLGQAQGEVQKLSEVLTAHEEELEALSAEIAKERATVLSLAQQVEKTQETIDESRRGPRVAYIVEDKRFAGREAWLVELGAKEIRVAEKDGASSVLKIALGNEIDRLKAFLEWVNQQPVQTTSFVVLIRPAAADYGEAVIEVLSKMGYPVGNDLLPDDWRPFE